MIAQDGAPTQFLSRRRVKAKQTCPRSLLNRSVLEEHWVW
jgi:hypothetical protein